MNIRGRNKVSPEFNMSSMTDIVFLLLIFFMLTSTLVTVSAIDVVLPKASDVKTAKSQSIAVSIKKNSKFYIGDDKKSLNIKQLEEKLLKLNPDKKSTITIRGEKNIPYQDVVSVMDIANKNKFKMVLAVKGN
ncbi:ExbD/TolR family protein [Aureivirga sp. CE67]|uniref:ExbD/TolR family protein n=1 Tax=Aureivirga sp. CE67 TaxID=1788983 RepID=UPI0018C9BE01|nr:biopolymer transporter ExbD [Aureivirga sp. CE67]